VKRSIVLLLAGLLVACERKAPDPSTRVSPVHPSPSARPASTAPDDSPAQTPAPRRDRATPTGRSAPTAAATQSAIRTCYLMVDRTVHVSGRCRVFPMGEDAFTLNTWDGGKPARSHFAVVMTKANGTATATWNADPDDDRATDPLGTVTRDGACWVNARTRICVE